MKNPCDICLVQACCTDRCKEYAIYVYKSKEYQLAGPTTAKTIDDMEYHSAIDHILMVENCYLSVRKGDLPL